MSEEQGSQACRRSELDVLAGVSSALIAMCDTRDDDCVQPACSPYETVHEKRVGGAVDVAPSNPSFEPAPAQVGALSSSIDVVDWIFDDRTVACPRRLEGIEHDAFVGQWCVVFEGDVKEGAGTIS